MKDETSRSLQRLFGVDFLFHHEFDLAIGYAALIVDFFFVHSDERCPFSPM